MPSEKPFTRRLATSSRPTVRSTRSTRRAGDAVALGQAQQVVIGPAAAVQGLRVEQGAHLAHGRAQVAVAAAVDGDRALRRRVEAQDHPHGGGLPGAVRAEEAGDQAVPDGERQVVDGGGGAVALDQAVGFDHRSKANGTARSHVVVGDGRRGHAWGREIGGADAEVFVREGKTRLGLIGVLPLLLLNPGSHRLESDLPVMHRRCLRPTTPTWQRGERLRMRRLGSQRQLGITVRERSRLCRWNRPAPFDQTVAVSARVAPPDAEERACPSFHQRERALAPDPDELLAERPLPLLADLALQAEQAPLGYLARQARIGRALRRRPDRPPVTGAPGGSARAPPAGPTPLGRTG